MSGLNSASSVNPLHLRVKKTPSNNPVIINSPTFILHKPKITRRITMQIENNLATEVIGASITVHKTLGPGLLESAYKECLFYELYKKGLYLEKEKPLPLVYEEIRMDCGYRLDLDIVVENKLIVEIKAIESLADIHLAQVLTYLKVSGCKLGLLINFNVLMLKDGIRRVIKT
jgi:GxxExxY protein